MRVASRSPDVQIITLEWPSAEPPGPAASLHRGRSRRRAAHLWSVRQREGRIGRGSRGNMHYATFGDRHDPVWQGARLRRGRRAHFQGRAVRRPDRRRESLAAREGSHSLGRRVPGVDLRRQLPSAAARLGERADIPLSVDRRLAERGHAQGEHLDVEPHRQAAGHVLHPWRRLHVRVGVRAGLAGWRADGASSRRRLGDREPSVECARLPRRLRARRRRLCRFGQRRHDRPRGGAPVGTRQHCELRR
jgi:hypothetical protein